MKSLLLTLLTAAACAAQSKTALDRYVAAPDSHFEWRLVNTIDGGAVRAYVLEMTSQKWLTEAEIDKPVWKHWVTIIRPSQVKGTTAFLFITGGANNSKPPEKPDGSLVDSAVNTGSIVVELRMVPNQPVKFPDAPKETYEDATIAYTWDKFLKTGDEKWPLRLPMTKAAVRAMDAATQFAATDAGGRATIANFVVAGASKRGWTTWTTAAVDKRVVAIAPIVIDVLNVEKSMTHHWRAYGFWAPAVGDYQAKDLMGWMGTPQNQALMAIEDPYSYRDRFTMPKYIVNSAGDQFFLPDSSQFYWDALTGEKHLRYVPNSDHSLRGSDAAQSLQAFYDMVLRGQARPRYSWKISDGEIEVTCQDQPTEVKLWQATNPAARDFRLMTIKNAYQATPLTAMGNGRYVAKIAAPPSGFTASFVELTFPSGGKYPLKVTTAVKVLPDTYPFPAPKARSASGE
jgi:PhoPQ-activated pathogenicity-related protein